MYKRQIRDKGIPIPIRMESEGIIKIISILNALIHAYSNPSICIAIDELDSGIFEYMPVSYTHLDVYKRQKYNRIWIGGD